jgi:r-opsin
MTISLWFMAWTPYLVINFTGIFDGQSISPLATIWASLFAKANAVYNPIVRHQVYNFNMKQQLS